jgi:hypothetical protein
MAQRTLELEMDRNENQRQQQRQQQPQARREAGIMRRESGRRCNTLLIYFRSGGEFLSRSLSRFCDGRNQLKKLTGKISPETRKPRQQCAEARPGV